MPAYQPPDYVDNDRVTLADTLDRIIREFDPREAAFASGYFDPKVWEPLGGALSLLESFRLLLGRRPEARPLADDRIDLARFFRDKLRRDVERLPLTETEAGLIDGFIEFLKRESVQVRLFDGDFLHAKAYIFPTIAIVGSSNFTMHGLTKNSELSLVQKSRPIADDLRRNWFDPKWDRSQDFKQPLLDILEESKFGSRQYTPYQVFIKVLYEYFKGRLLPPESRTGLDLAAFQQEGLQEAIRILDRHQGVLVADAVGLGKTYIGMGILERYLIHGRTGGRIPRGLVIAPAQLRDSVWRPKLAEMAIPADVLSQEEVGRQDFPASRYRNHDVVLVDESHNFRNAGIQRYQNLMRLLATGKRSKRVVLMTATPINNTVYDLYHQMLLLTKGSEAHYREFGVSNLKGFFGRVHRAEAELFDLLEQTCVRRSRYDIRKRQAAGEKVIINDQEVRFPDRRLLRVDYDLAGAYPGLYHDIAQDIERLSLVAYNLDRFRKQKTKESQEAEDRSDALIGIMKTIFLKRLESSSAAFEVSVQRQKGFQEEFFRSLMAGKRLSPAAHRRLLAAQESDDPADYAALFEGLEEIDAKEYAVKAIRDAIEADVKILDQLLTRVRKVREDVASGRLKDAKLEALKARLREIRARDVPRDEKKVLLFTYFHDTVVFLHRALRSDAAWLQAAGNPVIERIAGDTGSGERTKIIARFAPHSNIPKQEEERLAEAEHSPIDTLVSTDVLSEGQNLQDCGIVVNYDLHWNPVRMIQRAGRVDRIGSEYAAIEIHNFFPEKELEELLGLVERLQRRIGDIDRTIGVDSSVMGESVSPKSLEEIRRIKAADRAVLDELERESDLLSVDDMKLPLLHCLQALGKEKLEEIPLGIHSNKPAGAIGGTFLAFRAGDQHFWRVYPADGSKPIADKRKIFAWIACPPDEARMEAGSPPYELLERATTELLQDLRALEGAQKLRPQMTGINARIHELLMSRPLFAKAEGVAEEIRDRIIRALQEVPLRAFERDPEFKGALARCKEDGDIARYVEFLDDHFARNGLYQEETTRTTMRAIKREDLELIAFERLL